MPILSVVSSCALKVSVLRGSVYRELNIISIMHVVCASIIDQVILVAFAAVCLYFTPFATAALVKQNRIWVKLYLSLVSPELIRGFALILQIFDSESSMLFLVGCLILSLQFLCFQCLTNIRTTKLVVCAVLVVLSRIAVRYDMYSLPDIWNLGVIM